MPNLSFVLLIHLAFQLDFRPAGGGSYASKPRGKYEWMLICNIATVIKVNIGDTIDFAEYVRL